MLKLRFALGLLVACMSACAALQRALPDHHPVFPQLHDRSSLVMSLDRTGCYGTCPDYRVQIHGDGRVDYDGRCFVAVRGHAKAAISVEAVNQLFGLFQKADYFALKDSYNAMVTDNPTYTTSISFDGHNKSVSDYVGKEAGMPDSVATIENAIDKMTNSEQWISRNGAWKAKLGDGCP